MRWDAEGSVTLLGKIGMPFRHPSLVRLIPLAALLAAGCSGGTAALVASSGDSGGNGSAPPTIAAFAVDDPQVPGLTALRFTVSRRSLVEFWCQIPDEPPQRLEQVGDNPRVLEAGPHRVSWNFEEEPGLDERFRPGVRVYALIPGVLEDAREGENALTLGLGNDEPVVESALPPPASEVTGIVAVQLRISDSSGDTVALRAEFDVLGDEPDVGYRLARPGGLGPGEPTPELAFEGVVARASSEGGREIDFFWNTDEDLTDLARDVRLRFTAIDPVVEGAALETTVVHVDNNAAPIAQLDSGPLVVNPDQRRGIPIPFRVLDEEGDAIEMVFQWRRQGESFPELPPDEAALDALLADPVQRREHRVCTPYPHYARGRIVADAPDGTSVRLPELAAGESWLLPAGLVGQTLELLRPSRVPQATTWDPNPLTPTTVAALPLGDGLKALVLDVADGAGRLREIELATGAALRVANLAPGSLPSAMAFEHGGQEAVLVASTFAGTWKLDRIALVGGTVNELVVSDQPAPARGLVSPGRSTALVTAGSSLLLVDYGEPLAVHVGVILDYLATPLGIALDPGNEGLLYLAERDHPGATGMGRILAIDLDTHSKRPVRVDLAFPAVLEQPEQLTFVRGGARLLFVARAGGDRQLFGLDLGGRASNVPFPIGAPLPGAVQSLASGPDELLLLALEGRDQLLVGGGLEQRRVITAFDPEVQSGGLPAQRAIVAPAFEPPARPGQPWRIPFGARRRAQPAGLVSTFVWDSSEAQGGEVFLRGLPRDDERGTLADGLAPKPLRAPLDADPLALGGSGVTDTPLAIAAADLNEDGAVDLVSANQGGDDLRVFLQEAPGSYAAPLGLAASDGPVFVLAADLDGDGDQDLVSASPAANSLNLFRQESGSLLGPTSLGGTSIRGPVSVAAADLDGDGALDLVSANRAGNNLALFYQQATGDFPADPQAVRGSGTTTRGPVSVVTADFDGDGDLDLVSANQSGSNLTLFRQEPRGTLATSAEVRVTGRSGRLFFVAAADLDGDGSEDLVSANENDLALFFQEAGGSLAAEPLLLDGEALTFGPRWVAAADLDGDGAQDLVAANFSGNGLTAFFQAASGPFGSERAEVSVPPVPAQVNSRPVAVVAADLDGDGDQDLASANGGIPNQGANHDLTVFLQGSPGSPLEFGENLEMVGPLWVTAADLDGDGDQDLASARGINSINLNFSFQVRPGTFLTSQGPSSRGNPVFVGASDLDGDGDQDLVSANPASNNLQVFLQEATGAFATPVALGGTGITGGVRSIAIADLDGKEGLDLVTANKTGHDLTVFLQESGRFPASPQESYGDSTTTNGPNFVIAADLDGNGRPDIVSANEGSHSLTVFFQEESGFPATPTTLGGAGVTDGAFHVALGDLDADGDLDLVSANKLGDGLTVFLLDPTGSFSGLSVSLGGPGLTDGPVCVAPADLDADGDVDLCTGNEDGDSVTLFLQEAPGRFRPSTVLAGDSPVSLVATDLDGDGDQDLVAVNRDAGRLTVYWGGR